MGSTVRNAEVKNITITNGLVPVPPGDYARCVFIPKYETALRLAGDGHLKTVAASATVFKLHD